MRSQLAKALPALLLTVAFALAAAPASAAEAARVSVILWFDTEDYLLPASDDAARKIAEILTAHKVRATFKVVGEKARALERRKRTDVIAALSKHEIGYHSNYHSTQPTPALYLSNLTWDDGVAEFDRRERGGFEDVKRVFGQAPSCYGQPGSSWGPQAFGAMRGWGMGVYLDAGSHVGLDGKPHYYCGVLTLYRLKHTLHCRHASDAARKAEEEKFAAARQQLLAEGGGIVSIFAHPCEWVHGKFWDGVNFARGANPPREAWQPPPQLAPDITQAAYRRFDEFIGFMQRFPDVEFITASQAARLYRDRAVGRTFSAEEIVAIAQAAQKRIDFQRRDGLALSAADVFSLLNGYVAGYREGAKPKQITLSQSLLGTTSRVPPLAQPSPPGGRGQGEGVKTTWNQFARTARDVDDFMAKRGRIPSAVWLGSVSVTPEAYLRALAEVVPVLAAGDQEPPREISVAPAKLEAARYVADDDPRLWGWVIFPPGFRAPALMEVARRQSWTIKPALR